MDAKTTGAWLVHHTLKLQQINGAHQFDNIFAAGKAGILLSALSASDQTSLPKQRVEVLAKAAQINTVFELPKLLELLSARSLVQVSQTGVDVLGVTTPLVVQHAADVYSDLGPSASENAALFLAELTSQAPLRRKDSATFLSDTCKLTDGQTSGLLEQVEDVGLVDFEDLGGDKVYFNGNLFRRDQITKTQAVLSSLTPDEQRRVAEVDTLLKQSGCVALSEVTKIQGLSLFEKLNSVAMYDVSVVNNEQENVAFVTRPAAFSKYGNPLIEDALDLAKAFVSSLTYGMTRSSHSRGRIRMIEKLMTKLINGGWVGSVDAIGKDYRALELKGVVQVKGDSKSGYFMNLLKRDIGVVALEVIKAGDATDVLLHFPGATVTGYIGPEANREKLRKKQTISSKSAAKNMLAALRTGGSLK